MLNDNSQSTSATELSFQAFRLTQEGSSSLLQDRAPLKGTRSLHHSKIYLPVSGINPLISAASPLLTTLSRLKESPVYENIDHLSTQLTHEITAFESAAYQHGFHSDVIAAGRYVICAALDEAILKTGWGNAWGERQLLSEYHKELANSERFFVLLNRACEEPANHIELLELMYICMSLGFEGKYHSIENGKSDLEEITHTLYKTIRSQRGNVKKALLIQNHDERSRPKEKKHLSFGLISLTTFLFLTVIYFGFHYVLHLAAMPIFQQLTNT
jgi:type VI secretion system protein ImpK